MNVSRGGCKEPLTALDEAVDREFDVLSFDVDAEAKSDSVTSVYTWKEHLERERLDTEVEHLRARHESIRADIALMTLTGGATVNVIAVCQAFQHSLVQQGPRRDGDWTSY